jgi:predicted PurR-regulated permease PerM
MIKDKFNSDKQRFSNLFLLAILLGILYLCYLLMRPFLYEIILSGILVTIFYPVYLKIAFWTRGRLTLASLITCLLIYLIVIIPFSLFLYYLANEAIALYSSLASSGTGNVIYEFFNAQIWQRLNFTNRELFDVQQFIIESLAATRAIVLSAASAFVTSVANLIVSILIMFVTTFFLFLEGRNLLTRLKQLTPLSNKYDKLIWLKFRDVSYTTIVATFITSLAQAAVGAIGFAIAGLPVLLGAVLIFVFSFLPYIGTSITWIPAVIYLLVNGNTWQGIFMLCWGLFVISLIDNILRPLLIKGKAHVHPMIIFFSVFGGIMLIGFWGIIFGPLIIALAFTILHIYELEYGQVLEK